MPVLTYRNISEGQAAPDALDEMRFFVADEKPPAPAEGSAVQVRTFPETTVYVK